jgi:penicillin-binding protein-related factor A (putative recombinase)
MIKKESKESSKIHAWIRWYIKTYRCNCAVELKHTRGKETMPMREIYDHQKSSLNDFKDSFVWKIDDAGFRQKPFDYVGTYRGDPFVAIRFVKDIYIIPIEEILKVKSKSLDKQTAKKIAFSVIR